MAIGGNRRMEHIKINKENIIGEYLFANMNDKSRVRDENRARSRCGEAESILIIIAGERL